MTLPAQPPRRLFLRRAGATALAPARASVPPLGRLDHDPLHPLHARRRSAAPFEVISADRSPHTHERERSVQIDSGRIRTW
jgi:hypothetical protein